MTLIPKNKTTRLILLLSLFLSIAFYDVVFLGKTFKVTTANSQVLPTGAYGQANNKPRFIPVNGTDSPVMEEPSFEFIRRNIRQGILPLWNPHQACGFPFIGMIEVGFFFPLNFIMYIFPSLCAWDILILTRLLCAGLFAFWFMRTMRFRFVPSLTTAIVFMLTGPLVLLQYWTANVDILVPLVCLGYERLLRRTSLKNTGLLSLLIGMTFLAGHPEHIFLVNFFGFLFLSHRAFVFFPRLEKRHLLFAISTAYVLGIGLSALVLFPFLRNLLSEFWTAHPEKVGLLLEEHRERALSILLPHFFQSVPLTYKFEFAGWWGGYIGTLPTLFAALSLFAKQKRGLNYFLAVVTFLLVSKQYALPYINWIGYLPIFNQCRYASHTPMLVAFSIAVLAGMGVRLILHPKAKQLFIKASLPALLILFVVGVMLFFQIGAKTFFLSLKASFFALMLIAIFLLILFLRDRGLIHQKTLALVLPMIIFVELFSYIHRERPRRFDSFGQVPYIELLKSSPEPIRSYGNFWAFYPNTASGFQVDDLGFFFGLAPKRFVHFVNTLIIRDHFRNDLRPPALRSIPIQNREDLFDLLNVKYIITPATDDFQKHFPHFENPAVRYPLVYAQEVKIYERPAAYPRAFIVHRALWEPDEDKSLAMLGGMKKYLRHAAVINYPIHPKLTERLKGTPVTDNSQARIIKYTANEVHLITKMENPGFLILADAYHPDWKAFVDGKETTVYQTDYLLRSVFLPAGLHRVQFVFRPRSFYVGVIVSLISLCLIVLLLLSPRRIFRQHE